MKTQTRVSSIGVRQSHHASYSGRKAFTTPKRRPRARLNGCYSGDSPSEIESPQDIIWDSSSPTQSFNGDSRVIEISEIVNRIAPKVERSKEGDSMLQWIGDSAIRCTPEIRQPRFRRIGAWRSNVEDLKKLAKQFDINMTRQESTEKINKLSKLHSEGTAAVSLEQLTSLARQEEEELQALFDAPTQHISGKLSPPSPNCTPETSTEPTAQAGQRKSKKTLVDAPKSVETKFDDWENDDFLNDLIVLEMTQNPVPLNVAQKPSTTLSKSCSKKCNFEAKVNPSISNARNICFETQESTNKSCTFSKTLPDVLTSNRSTFKLKQPISEQNHSNDKLLKTPSVNQEKLQTQPGYRSTRPAKLDRMTNDCGVSRQTTSDADMKSLFDSDGLWNDKDDDDLLCQACHEVEKLSSSQEQQRRNDNYKNLAHDKPRIFASKASSSSDPVCSQSINSRGQSRDPTRSTHVFARSNSVPCTSGSSGFKQGFGVLPSTKRSSSILGCRGDPQNQVKSSQVKNLLEFAGSTGTSQTVMPRRATSDSHQYIFERHLSESMELTNKVFIPSHTTVRCSDAEIERKKQEAIVRRRLRILASQKMEHL